jgi:RNA polymerase sigma factor (sigma-70 family)
MARGIEGMAELSTGAAARPLDVLFREGTLGSLSDGQLLERFLASGAAAGAAFDVLMARHGPMVLGVCRRILRDGHAADDSFQATFLVLVRRAEAIRRRESVGPWLHGVARRVALRARAAAMVRQQREARAAIDPGTAVADSDADDLGPALHAEIDRLPEKYRAPIVLCYLQGRTIDEASRQLGWPVGTVGGRLARARDRLRDRLVQQGLVAPTALAAALAPDPAYAGAVPRALARSTHTAALRVAAGRAATAVVTATVANLLEETLRTMAWTPVMIGATACALLGALVLAAAGMSLPSTSPEPAPQQPLTRAAGSANPERPTDTLLTRTLQQASQAASTLSDPQERVDTLIALAWAQIKGGDRAGARAGLDRAVDASGAFRQAEPRCISRVRIAQARGEAGDRHGGLTLLTLAVQDAQLIGRRSWVLKSIAVAQCELGDREAALATIQALDRAILTPEQRLQGMWTSELTALAEARIAAGDFDEAFRTCIPTLPADGNNRHFQVALQQEPWMLMELASAAADANHESRFAKDPPRPMTAGRRAARLALVRRAVVAVEELPKANERRPILAVSLAMLGAFDEALAAARRIDQKQIRGNTVDATWALWRISLEQARIGKFEDARATIREAAQVERPLRGEDEEMRNKLCYGFIAARDFDGALKSAETLDPNDRAAILSHVAGEKLRAGDRAGAEPLFRRALEEVERFRNSPSPPRRQPQQSPPPVEVTSKDPQTRNQIESLTLLAVIHARASDWASATKALTAIPLEGREKGMAAFHIALIRARSGDVAGDLAWALSLPSSSLRAWAIQGLAFSIYDDRAYRF